MPMCEELPHIGPAAHCLDGSRAWMKELFRRFVELIGDLLLQ